MPLLALLPWRRIALVGAVLALIAVGVVWLRQDAVEDDRAKASEKRIEHILKARERRHETRGLDDDDLRRELLDRVRRNGPQ